MHDFNVYCEGLGYSRLNFAKDLASRLKVPLQIVLKKFNALTAELQEQEHRVKTMIPGAEVVYEIPADENSLLVAYNSYNHTDRHTLVVPQDESLYDPYQKCKIMVPLGNAENGIEATKLAIKLANIVGSNILFWHTTWPDESIDSDDPRDNMCPRAKDIMERCVAMTEDIGLLYSQRIEMWPGDIATGCVQAAHEENCSLILMKLGAGIVQGSWCYDVSDISTIPVLIAS